MPINFTPREIQILALIAQALLRKNIASQLKISIKTVDAHLHNIHAKTGTSTTAELMLFIATMKNRRRK